MTAIMLKDSFWVGYNIYVIPALTFAIEYLKDPPEGERYAWMDTLLEMITETNWGDTDSYISRKKS